MTTECESNSPRTFVIASERSVVSTFGSRSSLESSDEDRAPVTGAGVNDILPGNRFPAGL